MVTTIKEDLTNKQYGITYSEELKQVKCTGCGIPVLQTQAWFEWLRVWTEGKGEQFLPYHRKCLEARRRIESDGIYGIK